MTIVKNRKNKLDFYVFDTYIEALEFLDTMPKWRRRSYEVIKPQKNPLENLMVR